jgi:Tol biopolymer transport system component
VAEVLAVVLVSGGMLVPVSASASGVQHVLSTKAGPPPGTAFVPVESHRLSDTVVASQGASTFKVLGVGGVPATGVGAVALKLTASKPAASGALVAYPTGARRPGVLSVSFSAGQDATAVVVVTPGSNGRVTAVNLSAGGVRVVPTVVGFYRAATKTSASLTYFKPVSPRQIASVRIKARGSVTFAGAGAHGVPAAATGVVVELTALTPAKSGTFTVSPADGVKSKINALRFSSGHTVTNLVTAAPGKQGRLVVANTSAAAVRVRVDVVGYLLAIAPSGSAPTAVKAAVHPGGAVLTWRAAKTDPGAPVLRYGIVVNQKMPWITSHTVYTSGPKTKLDVTGLTDGRTYTFQVFAVTREGNGAPSRATPPVLPSVNHLPAVPSGLLATAAGAGAVTVSWAQPENGRDELTSYIVSGTDAGPVTVAAPMTQYTFTGLTVGQRFVATVKAVNVVGTSGPSAPSNAVTVTGPAGTNVTSAVSLDEFGKFRPSGVGTGQPAVSADGRYVAFSSTSGIDGFDNNGVSDVFVRDRLLGTTVRVSTNPVTGYAGNGASTDASISANGQFVAFDSLADDLLPAGLDTNGREDVFVKDMVTGSISRVSVTSAGLQGDKASLDPAISADGSEVAFLSNSTDLVLGETNFVYNVYLHGAGSTIRVSRAMGGGSPAGSTATGAPAISADGRFVGYQSDGTDIVPGDTNGVVDAFVFDTSTSTTTRVSVGAGGAQADAASSGPELSSDGRYAVFSSDASNLVAGDTNGKSDVFVRDLVAGTTTRVSVGNDGSQGNDASTGGTISADGSRVLFTSLASNLVGGDTNGVSDAFVRHLATHETIRASVATNSAACAQPSTAAVISPDGGVALFTTADGNVVPSDSNQQPDLFARTLG